MSWGLHLHVVPAVEQVGVPLGGFLGGLPVVGHEVARHLAGHARRRHHEPLVVPGKHLPVDAGLVVEALRVADRGQLHQVAVPLHVPGEQDQMVVRALTLTGAGLVPAVSRGDVGLHPDDGLQPFLPRPLVEVPGAEHAPVVGERQAGHLLLFRLANQVRQAVRAVEKGVLRVGVEVDEAHCAESGGGSMVGRDERILAGAWSVANQRVFPVTR